MSAFLPARAMLAALALAGWGGAAGAQALPEPAHSALALPEPVHAALAAAGLADASLSVVVRPLDGGTRQAEALADLPRNPASTLKLVTTLAALELLGPDHRWHTRAWSAAALQDGTLAGDLVIEGGGDPALVSERWWLLVQQLRAAGVARIRGDLVLDRSRFAPASAPSLDGQAARPYNALPDPLLIDHGAVAVTVTPDPAHGRALVSLMPPLEGMEAPTTVALSRRACGNWLTALHLRWQGGRLVPGAGYPLACGMRTGYLRAPDPAAVAGASFRALWRQAGGRLDGRVRAGPVPQGARLLADGASPPLAEVIRAINKHSNNVMARTLFLSLAQADGGATLDRATGRTPMGGDAPGTLDGTQDGAPEGPAEALVDALVDAVAEAPAGSPADTAAQASLKAPADAATQATAQGSAQVAAQVAAQASGDPGRDDAADLAVPAAAAPVPPWTGAAAERALRQWLLRIGVPAPGLVVRNGSGLSREERISARSLAALLVHAWAAPAMPDYLASLPQAGVDGTMAHRPVRAGAAWIKTGTLDGVRAVAGYVQAASGHRYAVVGLLNDPAAAGAQGALDALLRWVAEGG